MNNHAETIQRVFDVVKRTKDGVDFSIFGIENQMNIHYAMPLRHMVGDALSYLKEYNEIAKINREQKNYTSSAEFLSAFQKSDRLHPMLSICIYYGEDEWDGPTSLKEMMNLPSYMDPFVSDYTMNLIQLRKSEHLNFQNEDVRTFFEISRSLYSKDYDIIQEKYHEKTLSSELGIAIGSVTHSPQLIKQALSSESEGGNFDMCKALEELWEDGLQKGITSGIQGSINICKKLHTDKDSTLNLLISEFSLSDEAAAEYIQKFW